MREYVEQLAGGVGNEEASHTPRLVDQIMDDLASDLFRTTIDLVHIIHLDRQIGHGRTRTPFAHDADLGDCSLAGRPRDDPSEIHDGIEYEKSGMKIPNVRDRVWRCVSA